MTHEGYPRPPAAPDTQSNCLKVAGITCLVAAVVAIAVIAWIVSMMTKNPAIRQAYSGAKMAAECQLHLQNPQDSRDISEALERYVKRNGIYPARLEDLYPNFLDDSKILHCPADPRPVETVSYEYAPPAVDAPGSTVVVRCGRHVLVQGQPPLVLLLYKDGRVVKQGYNPRGTPQ